MSEDVMIEELLEEPAKPADNQASPEPAKRTDNLDKSQDTSAATDGKVSTTIASTPYTSEELKSIPIERWDINRIPDTAKPFYERAIEEKKSLQSGFTKTSQELAELKKSITTGGMPRSIEEAFDGDPIGVFNRIGVEVDNREIQLANLDPILNPEECKTLRVEIARLRSLERNLNQRAVSMQNQRDQHNAVISETMAEVRKEIKDYDAKRPELEKFTYEELGYTEQEVGVMTDARIVGKAMAIKNFKIINRLFEMTESGKKAELKLKQIKPNQLERDTGSSESKENLNTFEELDTYLTKNKL